MLHASVLGLVRIPAAPATRCLRFGDSWSKEEKFAKYQKAVGKGLLNLTSMLFISNGCRHCKHYRMLESSRKIMAKMGISTLRSYKGAQIADAIGLSKEQPLVLHVIDTRTHNCLHCCSANLLAAWKASLLENFVH